MLKSAENRRRVPISAVLFDRAGQQQVAPADSFDHPRERKETLMPNSPIPNRPWFMQEGGKPPMAEKVSVWLGIAFAVGGAVYLVLYFLQS
jgi:hypothetical protein